MTIKQLIKDEAGKYIYDCHETALDELTPDQQETGEDFEQGALWAMRWWATRWNIKDELEGHHALTLTEQQRLYPALRDMDAAAKEILENKTDGK